MLKKALYISFFLLAGLGSNAQQIGMYSHYFYKPMVYNPAFAGVGTMTNVMVISRSQWSDFSGAPQLNLASLDGSIIDRKVGLGVMIVSDRKGITNRIGGDVFYSYRLNINDDMHLRFGVSLGVVEHTIDYSKAIVESGNDNTLFANSQSKTVMNGNAGLAFVWKDLDLGFAVPQVIGNRVNYVDTSNIRSYYAQARHYMGSLRYRFAINKEKGLYISPQALVRFVPNTPFQYDGNVNFEWVDKFWIGATYKSDYAVSANVGFCFHKQFEVGYSYDIIIGNIGKYSGMAHELMISFKFGKKKKEEEKKEEKELRNAMYERTLDSLQTELEISQTRQKQLNDKVDQLSKQVNEVQNKQSQMQVRQPQNQNTGGNPPQNSQNPPQNNQNPPQNNNTSVGGNQNATIGEGSTNKRVENGVLIMSGKTMEFKNDNGIHPPKGYYVVIGTYYYRDLAEAEAARFVARGYKTTDWVYSGPKQYNYIFMFKLKTKEEAIEKLKVARDAGVKDAWIQEITD